MFVDVRLALNDPLPPNNAARHAVPTSGSPGRPPACVLINEHKNTKAERAFNRTAAPNNEREIQHNCDHDKLFLKTYFKTEWTVH